MNVRKRTQNQAGRESAGSLDEAAVSAGFSLFCILTDDLPAFVGAASESCSLLRERPQLRFELFQPALT